ncbi:hypothetical protein [Paenibacillus silagei]|uniref:Nuclease n=1 Tax=Paenibacillus silagei TaxID=1670801 RepID=A0ABS4NVI2_9BACL|nr:hypothetical protein [Paenibacillus silagei]MBP2114077.1 hypothetical protein [Paenibacillus silagei]
MKGNLFTSYYSQLENQITEAFLKVMMYSTSDLTDSFLNFIGLKGEYGVFSYDFQFGNDIQMNVQRAVLIGIAETRTVVGLDKPVKQEDVEGEGRDGIPDGYIYAGKGTLALLFEMKRGGGKLYRSQLNAHKQRFQGIDMDCVEEVILTWKQVLSFFEEQRMIYSTEHRNYLLIEGFLSFCEFHFVGEVNTAVSPERIIARYDMNGYLKSLHEYCIGLSPNSAKSMRDSINYYVKGRSSAFFTVWYGRGYLVLKPQEIVGLQFDLLVAQQFGICCSTPYDYKTQETFIRIDWIQTPEQLEQVKLMIKLAYDSKINKQTFEIQQFIQEYGITINDFSQSRLAKKGISYFEPKTAKVEELRKGILSVLQG